ncbi:MAG: hypothetical protein ACR2OV_00040 [Hyphomicrobiaceae bacterium]
MTDKYLSPPLKKPLRDLCPHCRERPREPETELCENCTILAMYERVMEDGR